MPGANNDSFLTLFLHMLTCGYPMLWDVFYSLHQYLHTYSSTGSPEKALHTPATPEKVHPSHSPGDKALKSSHDNLTMCFWCDVIRGAPPPFNPEKVIITLHHTLQSLNHNVHKYVGSGSTGRSNSEPMGDLGEPSPPEGASLPSTVSVSVPRRYRSGSNGLWRVRNRGESVAAGAVSLSILRV